VNLGRLWLSAYGLATRDWLVKLGACNRQVRYWLSVIQLLHVPQFVCDTYILASNTEYEDSLQIFLSVQCDLCLFWTNEQNVSL